MFSVHKASKYFFIILIFSLFSCNKNSKNPFARLYHNTTAYFNYYYNADKLYKEKLDEINKNYQFPSTGFIEIYHVGNEEEMKTYEADLDKIIKKNEVLIYKHPNSRWVDNARHLEGKAFFYKGQYDRGLRNYEEIIAKYAASKITNDVYLWLAKTYFYMDNKEMTYTIMKEHLVEKPEEKIKFKKKFKGELAIFQSTVSIEEKNYTKATVSLEDNLKYIKGKNKVAKTHYLLGQLYETQNNFPMAISHYNKTEKLSDEYSIVFKSKLQKARMMIQMKPDAGYASVFDYMYKLEKDLKNKEYLDQIYYELSTLEQKQNNLNGAMGYLKKSVAASTSNTRQKALSYYRLGQIYFYNKKNYDKAGAYFDSASQAIDIAAAEYKEIKMVQSTLKDYVTYKKTIAYQDSMLSLADMPKEKLDKIVDNAIAAEEKRKKEAAEKAESIENQSILNLPGANPNSGMTWAFDDPAQLSEGKLRFQQVWGNRKNEDNWRRKNKQTVVEEEVIVENDTTPVDSALLKAFGDRYKYFKEIPFEEKDKVIAREKIETALYRLGNIFDQKLNQADSAIATFEVLLRRFPETEYILPAKYSLYRLWKSKNNPASEKPKNFILKEYPKSIYAMLIMGVSPEEIAELTRDFDFAYNGLYRSYRNKEYETALGFSSYLLSAYADHNDVDIAQVYYLRAMCFGFMGDTDSLRSGLTFVVKNFPESAVKPLAQRTLDALNGKAGTGAPPVPGLPGNPLPPGSSEDVNTQDGVSGTPPVVNTRPKVDPNDPRIKDFNKDPRPNSPFYVLLFLDRNGVNDTESNTTLTNFNKEKFKDKKVFTFNYENTKKEKFQILYVTRFNNEFEASEYIYQLSEAQLIDKLILGPADRILFITQDNFTTAYGKKRMEDYLFFYDNVITF
ncbi:MAG: tetratricopeptide repeat protein [Bacteroidia bacterium]|nr:tetratricopeptide repeat protein [Bacteroidia bacterium]